MTVDTIKQLLELGWPGVVTFFFCYLAVQYIKDQPDQIAYLRQVIQELEAKQKENSERLFPEQ